MDSLLGFIKNNQKQSLIATWGGLGFATLSILGTIYLGSIGESSLAMTLIAATTGVILATKGISAFTTKDD